MAAVAVPTSLLHLPDELILEILLHVQQPHAFSRTCSRIRGVCLEPWSLSRYFLARGRRYAFASLLGAPGLATPALFDTLHASGARISRWLGQEVVRAATTGKGRGRSWATGMKLPTLLHFLGVIAKLYPSVDLTANEDDGTLFRAWVCQNFPGMATHLKGRRYHRRVEWSEIEDALRNGFTQYSPGQNLTQMLAAGVSLDFRVLPLLISNGYVVTDAFRSFLFRALFTARTDDASSLLDAETVADSIKRILDFDRSISIPKGVVAELFFESWWRTSAFEAVRSLDLEGYFDFSVLEVAEGLLRSFYRTRSCETEGRCIETVFEAYPSSDPIVREVVLVTVFNTILSVEESVALLDELRLLPLSSDDLAGVLANPFSAIPFTSFKKICRALKIGNLPKLLLLAVPKGLQTPSTGSFFAVARRHLNALPPTASKPHPGISRLRARVEAIILGQYQLDTASLVADIPPSRDAMWRQVPMQAFRAPLAYDYEEQSNPYGLTFCDMVPHKVDLSRIEAVDPRRFKKEPVDVEAIAAPTQKGSASASDPPEEAQGDERNVASILPDGLDTPWQTPLSDWLVRENSYMKGSCFAHRGTVRYHSGPCPKSEDGKSYSAGDGPVAEVICDLFGPTHPVSKVFFDHALVNGNLRHLKYALFEGAEVSTRHFQILAALGRPVQPCMWEAMVSQRFVEEVFKGKTVPPGREEVEPLEDAVNTDSPDASRSQGNRPRRHRNTNLSLYVESVPEDDDEDEEPAPKRSGKKASRRSKNVTTRVSSDHSRDEDSETKTISSLLERLRWLRFLSKLIAELDTAHKAKIKPAVSDAPVDPASTKAKIPAKPSFLRQLITNFNALAGTHAAELKAAGRPAVASYRKLFATDPADDLDAGYSSLASSRGDDLSSCDSDDFSPVSFLKRKVSTLSASAKTKGKALVIMSSSDEDGPFLRRRVSKRARTASPDSSQGPGDNTISEPHRRLAAQPASQVRGPSSRSNPASAADSDSDLTSLSDDSIHRHSLSRSYPPKARSRSHASGELSEPSAGDAMDVDAPSAFEVEGTQQRVSGGLGRATVS